MIHRSLTYLLTLLLAMAASCGEVYAETAGEESESKAESSTMPLGLRYTKMHPLIIVADWKFFPYTYCNDKGGADGYIIDIVHEIFDNLHIPYEVRMMDWQTVQEMVKGREAHLMIDLEKYDGDPSLYYGTSAFGEYRLALAHRKGERAYARIADIPATDTLYVRKGDYLADYLKHLSTQIKCHISYADPHSAMQRIIKGKMKHYAWGYEPMRQMMLTLQDAEKISLTQITDIPAGKFHFRSVDRRLLAEIDRQFERIVNSGHYDMVTDKWFSQANDGHSASKTANMYIFPIVFISLILVITVVCIIIMFRIGRAATVLRKEFIAISDMMMETAKCQLAVMDVRELYIRNVKGTILPPEGLTLREFEASVHPDDIMEEYKMRNDMFAAHADAPSYTFRIRNHGTGDFVKVEVTMEMEGNTKGKPTKVYMVMKDEGMVESEE